MKKALIPLVVMTAIFVAIGIACFRYEEKFTTSLFSVKVVMNGGTEEIPCWMNPDGEGYVFLPAGIDMKEASILLHTSGTVSIGEKQIYSGMLCDVFQQDTTYQLKCSDLKAKEYSVQFVQSANVPTMFIDTESGSMEYIHAEKGNEEAGEMRLYLPDGTLSCAGEIADINGRGNYTWENSEKKPYSLQLTESMDLMGLGEATKWILLANSADPSHMRNKLVFEFANMLQMAYTPDACWLDVYLNGEYVGLYLLTERIQIHPQRVAMENSLVHLVSVEVEKQVAAKGERYVSTRDGLALRLHDTTADEVSSMRAIETAYEKIEGILLEEKQSELLDIKSWVYKYIIDDICGNADAGVRSHYLIIDEDRGKIQAGPVWDYDLSLGNTASWQFENPESFIADRKAVSDGVGTWLYAGLSQQGWFEELARKELLAMDLPYFLGWVAERTKEYTSVLECAGRNNQIRWNVEVGIGNEVKKIMDYLENRISFLLDRWLGKADYVCLQADPKNGSFYASYAVVFGKQPSSLPTLPDTPYQSFLGWYYEGTDEPFDPTRPIYEDTAVYAKWEDTPYKKMERVKKLVPAAVLAMMFLAVLGVNLRRMRKGG